ncbi:unnamed protein product [Phytomonas sp. EM1]|nr:unnamed protein product [Phytomonas sp. EM1]|eukprot:CCW60747.1 unnamed protein product [Phytomonas sp. isolate EM1]
MKTEQKIWLGVPQGKDATEDVLDPFTSKVGGHAALFRDVPNEALKDYFGCPKCGLVNHVSLLAQLYAPLDCYDRVLYILTCAKCGVLCGPSATGLHPSLPKGRVPAGNKKNTTPPISSKPTSTSFCFALRSQNFNSCYYKEMVERAEQERRAAEERAGSKRRDCGNMLFQEEADWDDISEPCGADIPIDVTSAPTQMENSELDPQSDTSLLPLMTIKEEPSFALCKSGCLAPLKGCTFTNGIPLNIFIEPQVKKENFGSTEDQLREAQKKYGEGAALDTTSFEEDDESPVERCVRKYVERVSRVQTQCVRWSPDGEPLRSSLSVINVPLCPLCGAERRFELQLTSPLVYFLTMHKGEEKNDTLHFSNVLLYTCRKNCYSEATPYAQEYVVVEEEI